ncbi:MAG: hypothetical protein RBR02_09480 [Desulfuromonadaceae bacterium]|nr:hypothetical protein [Desulfuromonadaceae bacterium]
MTIKLFGKERDTLTVLAVLVIVYFWFFVKIFNAPLIFGEYYASIFPFIAIGILIKSLRNDESELLAKYKTRKLITSYGIFEWDGSLREIQSGSQKFYVFYEGIDALGIKKRGDKVFVCPVEMTAKAGNNWLLKADLQVNGSIPTEIEPFTEKTDYCLYGNVQSGEFGDVSVDIQDVKSRMEIQDRTIKGQRLLLADVLKMLSDKHSIKTLGSDEIMDRIEKSLKGDRS